MNILRAILLVVLVWGPGCQKRVATRESGPTSQPVAESRPTASSPVEAEPAPTPLGPRSESQLGWLTVRGLHNDSDGGWATGDFDREKNRILVNTSNVNEFSIRLSSLPIDRSQRIRLRIDGRNREISRELKGTLVYHQSSGGSWELVED